MVQVGQYNTLRVVKEVDFGMYLDGGEDEILLPKRYVPQGLKPDDEISVFIYHDNEGKLIATTAQPFAVVGEIAMMEVGDVNEHGAFLKWGIMKDVFVPISQQELRMKQGDKRLVRLFIDERTGRVTGSEKIDKHLNNYDLTVQENDPVDLVVFQKTDIGYKVIINSRHMGVLHFNEIFRELQTGDKLKGYVKHIRPDNKIDIAPGIKGYTRVQGEEGKILSLLQENNGYLPYNDKSDPEAIHAFFGMSKKTFKMTLGALYKKRMVSFTQTGTKLEDAPPEIPNN
jgi:predicted RNA-binding protein (virulence factor B family)